VAQRSIEILIGRLVTDEAFRTAFSKNAPATLTRFTESGHELTRLEIVALMTTHADLWARVAEQIDPRLQKASFSGSLIKEQS
jgi:hypothetical protein